MYKRQIKNVATGEELPIKRNGGTFVMKLAAGKNKATKKGDDKMEVNEAMDEEVESHQAPFTRRVL